MSAHHPPHIYLSNTWYFITASIHQKRYLLHPCGHKDFVRDQLKSLIVDFHLQLAAWVVLDNHYHFLAKSNIGEDLSRFIGRLHGRIAYELNRRDEARGRQVWHNYWDVCIRTETDYWTRFNYIHHNPLKHGYVRHMADWPFSSYSYYLKRKGEEWLVDAFNRYPILDFTDSGDEF